MYVRRLVALDVTDATFQSAVYDRSFQVPVVVDLWADWCGPCKQLGPVLERVVAATDGAVELAKVDVDSSPQVAAMFKVQSIPAVFAIAKGKVVDSFVGALPEPRVREFVTGLAPVQPPAEEAVAAEEDAPPRQDVPPDVDARLGDLLGRVKADEAARKEFLDLLEVLGPEDPRTAAWRKRLTTTLY